MKSFNRMLLLLVITMTATACTTTPTVVTVPQNVLITPPDNFTVDCTIAPPPDRAAFNASDDAGKISALAGAYRAQVSNTDQCNKRLENMRKWISQNKTIYTTPPSGGK